MFFKRTYLPASRLPRWWSDQVQLNPTYFDRTHLTWVTQTYMKFGFWFQIDRRRSTSITVAVLALQIGNTNMRELSFQTLTTKRTQQQNRILKLKKVFAKTEPEIRNHQLPEKRLPEEQAKKLISFTGTAWARLVCKEREEDAHVDQCEKPMQTAAGQLTDLLVPSSTIIDQAYSNEQTAMPAFGAL